MNRGQPRISVVIPIHAKMKQGDFFLWRSIQSLMAQTFKDYELIIVQEGTMPVNTNAGMIKARGELIKIIYLDDYLAHPKALKVISDNFEDSDQWLVTGCLHQHASPEVLEDPHSPHFPSWTEDIHRGNNRLGSPSVLTIRNEGKMLFDENLSYFLDCDLYKRLYATYGPPKLVHDLNVVIGIGDHQTSSNLTQEHYQREYNYMLKKHG